MDLMLLANKQPEQMEPSPRRQTTLSVNVESLLSTNGQPAQLEALPNIQTAPFNVELHQFSTNQSSVQVGVSPKFQTFVSAGGSQQSSNKQSFHMEQSPRAPGSSSFSLALEQPLSINKHYVQMEPEYQTVLSANKGLKQISTNKLGKMEPLTKVQSATSPTVGTPWLSAKNKRKSHVEKLPKVQSINLGNQMTSSTNRRNALAEPSPKIQTESFESVRSKLRESLAAALALVSDQQTKPTGEASSTDRTDTQGNLAVSGQQGEGSSIMGNVSLFGVSETPESTRFKIDEHCTLQKSDQSHGLSSDIFPGESAGDYTQILKCDMQGFGLKHTSLEGDMSFSNNLAFKDELLQENGLCWASDLDVEGSDYKESGDPKRLKLTLEEATKDVKESVGKTQFLATKIEAELFSLFGGVNKKYKEKGRSLLFNLKDPNNPELRERVFSEQISPERLCSMTAEELASKQLSEWRIAKAEELAQMVVLPESDVDLRRLVKKTHKGEFQVEVERDDIVPVEVALGVNTLSQIPTRANETKSNLKSTVYEVENSTKHNETGVSDSSMLSKKVDFGVLERPQDMQEFMVDEIKDEEILPRIVSLSEFMGELDSVPPFETLPVTTEQDSPTDKKGPISPNDRLGSLSDPSYLTNGTPEKSKLDASPTLVSETNKASDSSVTKIDHSHAAAADLLDATVHHPDETDSRNESGDRDQALESGALDAELDDNPQGISLKGEHIWEGLVQLSISSLVTVLGVFKSGEKASTKEWPSFLEIKGRVRVDAFEKFLQELPSSRSRAVMVVHFLWKDGSPESGLTSIAETVDSYVADERVGYAEPAPGVELYLCPPHARTILMLERHIPEEHTEALASTSEGLIGIVVWRRPHVTSTVSPRGRHKHSSSKKHLVSRKQRSPNADVTKKPPLTAPPVDPSTLNPEPQPEDAMDDVPPGFGPGAARDEDDLPEFDFHGARPMASSPPARVSGVVTAQPHGKPLARQAEQMRELIHKYGQGGAGFPSAGQMQPPVQPWDDNDDDDDIPEWQPLQDNRPRVGGSLQHYQTGPHLMSIPPPRPSVATLPPPLASPLPLPMQPQMDVAQVPRSVQASWQRAAWWPHALSQEDAGFGLQRPCHYGGPPAERRYNGVGRVGNLQKAPRGRGV